MTWRITPYLLEGELDNTQPGKVTGWLKLAGMTKKVTLDLEGDFCRDIRGTKLRLTGQYLGRDKDAAAYMEGFAERQTGQVGHITAGLPPLEYTDYPYVEWVSETNDRVVLSPEAHQVQVIATAVQAAGPASAVPAGVRPTQEEVTNASL